MCLIGFSWQTHKDYPLIVAANRDEFYARATDSAHWWPGSPVLAGRDLVGGGTWLGVTRHGRFAALTNFREPLNNDLTDPRPSRGALVIDHLLGRTSTNPPDYASFAGFNLLGGDALGPAANLAFTTNRGVNRAQLGPGIYGMSNGQLDAPWPKVVALKNVLSQIRGDRHARERRLLDALALRDIAGDHALPDTGVGLEIERRLSAAFIQTEGYGTRCSSVLIIDSAGIATFTERSYDERANIAAQRTFHWRVEIQGV